MTVNEFWDKFEAKLRLNVMQDPESYALRPDESCEEYAKKVRDRFQIASMDYGLNSLNLGSDTFKALYKDLEPEKRFSQSNLRLFYLQLECLDMSKGGKS